MSKKMKYIRHFVSAFILTILGIGGINWFIDPYGMHWSPKITGINKNKTEAGNRVRLTKQYVVDSLRPEVVIIGNSRVEIGLDPKSPMFNHWTVYNFGIPGASLKYQITNALQQIESNKNLQHLIVSLDYLDFLYKESASEIITPIDELEAKKDLVELFSERTPLILSLDALHSSILTILTQQSRTSRITSLGFNDAKSFETTISTEGKKPLFKQKLSSLKTRLENKHLSYRPAQWKGMGPGFEMLAELIDRAVANEIELTLFINPYHYSYLQLLKDLGYWPDYLAWKRQLAGFVNQQFKQQRLFDFSGFNQYTKEPVNLSQPKVEMEWFWEPSHYRKELGDLLLRELLNNNSQVALARTLSVESIDILLEQDNIGLAETASQWEDLKLKLGLSL
ncbi:hypothetical protein BFC17_21190 [Alteromonas lipolytica]|uniref:Uncharacterized protein n=2 Tax=Alteromonas lipolytica TaxID=1856405 RepID=A0A1E8FE81_9ALTE|nr:hypothetical protein BFC17_21190 [Alteromonas lipolytica]